MLPHKKIKIMVVDDELSIRESLKGWLQQDGYQVETAAGGPEALAKNAESRFDIMLIDVKMPEMDGLTLLKKLKADGYRYRHRHDDGARRHPGCGGGHEAGGL